MFSLGAFRYVSIRLAALHLLRRLVKVGFELTVELD
jgi:hypothetical protein